MDLATFITQATPHSGSLEVTPRLIRYLITEGMLLSPVNGRKNADYPDENLDRFKQYVRLRAEGWSLGAIRRLFSSHITRVNITPGITLEITDPPDPPPLNVPHVLDTLRNILETHTTQWKG
jgi:DNA-binding transcriptional MerR regulator